MGHTEAHRPYWVHAVQDGHGEDHRHELLGAPKVIRRKQRDKHGRVVLVERPVEMSLYNASTLVAPVFSAAGTEARYRAVRVEARRRLAAGESQWARIDGPEVKPQPVYEEHTLGRYADYCTIDTPLDRDDRIAGASDLFAPCTRHLVGIEQSSAYSRTRGERRAGVHRDWRRPSRREVVNATRRLTLLADSGDDFEDDAAFGDLVR